MKVILTLFIGHIVVSKAFLSSTSVKTGDVRTTSLSQSVKPTATNSEYSIADSFNLVILGDLHMEDDMSHHEQARSDCIAALKTLSLLPSVSEAPLNGHDLEKTKASN